MTEPDRPHPAGGGRLRAEGSLRHRTARGTIINGAFLTLVNGLSMARGILVAAFLTTTEYGMWGILVVLVATLLLLKQVGIGEKYVQQEDEDQVRAFQVALTFELSLALGFTVLGAGLVLLGSVVYGQPDVIAPGMVLLLTIPAQALQFPLMAFYRRMDFAKQRSLQAIDPIVAFVVTIGLAIAGAGYWSLVVGTVAGACSAATAAVVASPVPLRLVFDRGQVGRYFGFSWPIAVSALCALVTAQGLTIAGEAELGLAAIGVIALCAQISQIADRADRAITETMYPAICAVRDRADLLFESFVKSNRLTLMWAVPFGVGIALFAEDLLVRVLGEEWRSGVTLLQATAITLAIHQIGFNWTAFYRARGDTKPLAVAGVVGMTTFFAIILPLLLTEGLDGLALGVLLAEVVFVILRMAYLRRLFPALGALRHMARAVVPVLPAAAVVVALRAVETGERGLGHAAIEALAFTTTVVACTVATERELIREAVGYLRRTPPQSAADDVAAALPAGQP